MVVREINRWNWLGLIFSNSVMIADQETHRLDAVSKASFLTFVLGLATSELRCWLFSSCDDVIHVLDYRGLVVE